MHMCACMRVCVCSAHKHIERGIIGQRVNLRECCSMCSELKHERLHPHIYVFVCMGARWSDCLYAQISEGEAWACTAKIVEKQIRKMLCRNIKNNNKTRETHKNNNKNFKLQQNNSNKNNSNKIKTTATKTKSHNTTIKLKITKNNQIYNNNKIV